MTDYYRKLMSGQVAKSLSVSMSMSNFNPIHCTTCGMKVDSRCGCLLSRASATSDRVMRLTRLYLAIERSKDKPRAKLIKAFSLRGGEPGRVDAPSRDTWVVRKELHGRIVRGYGHSLEVALADFNSVWHFFMKAAK